MEAWHESDEFWETFAPIMFGEDRWGVVPYEIDQVVARFGLHPGDEILDLCCGPGRHSLEMARRGLKVTGVDRTLSYLDKALQAAREEGLAIDFIHADMRQFLRPSTYHAVMLMFTSFGYFEDPAENLTVLQNAHASLKKDGSLLIEMMGKEVLARIFQPRSWSEKDGWFFLEERKLGKAWSWIENRWVIICGSERKEFEISHWLYSAAELGSMLEECGFDRVEFFGSLEGVPYDHKANRLIAVAHK